MVTTGPGVDPAGLGAQPPNVLVRQFLPQAAVLPVCDVLVSHADAGTMLGGLCHGLPQVCLPMVAEQPLNAAALANEQTAVDIQGRRLAASVQLVAALGGGWSAGDLPSAADLAADKPAW